MLKAHGSDKASLNPRLHGSIWCFFIENGNRLTEMPYDSQHNTVSDRQFTYATADRLTQAS
jgi:hypothetical protein